MAEARTLEEALSARRSPWLYARGTLHRGIDLLPPAGVTPPITGPVVMITCDDTPSALRAVVAATRAGAVPVLWPSRVPMPRTLARLADPSDSLAHQLRDTVHGPAVAVVTSGTTGQGAVVVLDQARALACAAAIAERMGPVLAENGVAGLRSYAFAAGLVGDLLASLTTGTARYAPPAIAAPELAVRAVADLPVRGVHCSTAVAVRVADALPVGLRHVLLSGDVVHPGAVTAVRARCPGAQVWAGYGLSEAGPRVSLGPVPPVPPLGWAGQPLPGVTVDVTGGALTVRSPYAAVAVLDGDGVRPLPGPGAAIDTGDAGSIVDGDLLVIGRRAAGATFDGTVIYPCQIEQVLSEAGVYATVTVNGDHCVVTLHGGRALISAARVRALLRGHFPFLPELRVHRAGPAPLTTAGKARR
jgi:acyl-CoA synthetase (AMP-forming)/AMP-acid ligase II